MRENEPITQTRPSQNLAKSVQPGRAIVKVYRRKAPAGNFSFTAVSSGSYCLSPAIFQRSLGNSLPHRVKFIAASELLGQVQDRARLAKFTNALNQHRQKRNAANEKHSENRFTNGHAMGIDNARGANVLITAH